MSVMNSMCCEYCGVELKRQFVGSNLLYYCNRCGRTTSEHEINDVKAVCDTVGACV